MCTFRPITASHYETHLHPWQSPYASRASLSKSLSLIAASKWFVNRSSLRTFASLLRDAYHGFFVPLLARPNDAGVQVSHLLIIVIQQSSSTTLTVLFYAIDFITRLCKCLPSASMGSITLSSSIFCVHQPSSHQMFHMFPFRRSRWHALADEPGTHTITAMISFLL